MILITGGSGFIGRHFHKALADRRVINLDLERPEFPHNATFVRGDIRIEEDVTRALHGRSVNTIISLAAKHHDFGIGHDEYFDTNEDGTRIICKMASAYEIKQIVFYSSVAVYGLQETISTEDTPPIPDSPYGASKLAGERVLMEWAAEDPARKLLILRPTVVFGPYNKANMFNLIRQIDSGFYFHIGAADNIKSIAYVENIVEATLYLLDRLTPGIHVYNYADEPQLTSRQISTLIAERLGTKVKLTVPRFLGVMMGLPFDFFIKITGRNLPISTARIRKLSTPTHHSATKLFSEGFQPKYTSIEGLMKMTEWYKDIEPKKSA